MLIRFSLVDSLGTGFERRMQPHAQVGVYEPPCQPRTDDDTWPQRRPHQFQVGKKIENPGLAGFLLNLHEANVQILGQIAKRVVDDIETQRSPDIIRCCRVAAAAMAGNCYTKSSGFGHHDALASTLGTDARPACSPYLWTLACRLPIP